MEFPVYVALEVSRLYHGGEICGRQLPVDGRRCDRPLLLGLVGTALYCHS